MRICRKYKAIVFFAILVLLDIFFPASLHANSVSKRKLATIFGYSCAIEHNSLSYDSFFRPNSSHITQKPPVPVRRHKIQHLLRSAKSFQKCRRINTTAIFSQNGFSILPTTVKPQRTAHLVKNFITQNP